MAPSSSSEHSCAPSFGSRALTGRIARTIRIVYVVFLMLWRIRPEQNQTVVFKNFKALSGSQLHFFANILRDNDLKFR